ncbi:hypothetical protein EDB87DRAFT_954082 [Lactarius vividus]|nr:hypothetical protein EDB87DRAFT_954082 [Lactarius vividus]
MNNIVGRGAYALLWTPTLTHCSPNRLPASVNLYTLELKIRPLCSTAQGIGDPQFVATGACPRRRFSLFKRIGSCIATAVVLVVLVETRLSTDSVDWCKRQQRLERNHFPRYLSLEMYDDALCFRHALRLTNFYEPKPATRLLFGTVTVPVIYKL